MLDWYSRRSLRGQWPHRCTSMGQDGSIELEMARIGPTVVEIQHQQEFGCPTGIPRRTQRHRWPCRCTSTGQNGSIELGDGTNGPSGCGVTVPARIWVPDGNSRKGPTGQWSCRWTSMGQDKSQEFEMVNHPSCCRVTASARIWVPDGNAWPGWANDNAVAHIRAKTVPWDLKYSESAQWLWSYSVRKSGQTNQWMEGQMNRPTSDYFIVPLTFLLKGRGH